MSDTTPKTPKEQATPKPVKTTVRKDQSARALIAHVKGAKQAARAAQAPKAPAKKE